MNQRRPATSEEFKRIVTGVRRRADVSEIVAKVLLTDRQRRAISEANAEGLLPTSKTKKRTKNAAQTGGLGYIHFLQGGAPGLVQQRVRRS